MLATTTLGHVKFHFRMPFPYVRPQNNHDQDDFCSFMESKSFLILPFHTENLDRNYSGSKYESQIQSTNLDTVIEQFFGTDPNYDSAKL